YSDLTAATNALNNVKVDTNIYFLIDHICSAIKKSDKDISRAQVEELVKDLNGIINQNLPDKKNIQHEGFRILAQLKVTKISKHLSIPPSFWEGLIAEIDSIPNLSDIVFVKALFLDDF